MKITVSATLKSSRWRWMLLAMANLLLTMSQISLAEKLSPDLKPPLYAQGAGGLRLEPPFEGPRAAHAVRDNAAVVKTYASIIKENNVPNIGNGEYSFSYETEDGVQREEVGKLKKVDDHLVTVVKGRYSYTSPEGLAIDVKYSADENGARSSFTFGTDPGRWKQSLLIPGLPPASSVASSGKKGKLETGREYLPPIVQSPNKKNNNEYLPPFPTAGSKKIDNDYLPPPSKR